MDEIRFLLVNFIDEFNSADVEKKQKMVEKFPFKGIKDKNFPKKLEKKV